MLYPIGIGLGPKYLTSAYYTEMNELRLVAKVEGSEAYQAYVTDTRANGGKRIQSSGEWYVRNGTELVPAPPDTHDEAATTALFVDALSTIKDVTEEAVGHTVRIGSITRMQHYNESTTRCLAEAGMLVDSQTFIRPWQVIWSPNAARLAYGLDSCEALGMNSKNCDFEEDENAVVIIDYSTEALEITYAILTQWGCLPEGEAYVPELGQKQSDNPAYLDHLQQALKEFATEHLPAATPKSFDRRLIGVILKGDAPNPAMTRMWIIVKELFKDSVKDSVNPLFVEAAGAAYRARAQVLDPTILDDIMSSNLDPPEGIDHGEL